MFTLALASTFIARTRSRRHPAATGRANRTSDTMLTTIKTDQGPSTSLPTSRKIVALVTFLVATIVSFVPLVGFATTAARACACGCSVFDVGGLDLPQ